MTRIQKKSTLSLLLCLLLMSPLSAQDPEYVAVEWETKLGDVVNIEILSENRLVYHTKNTIGVIDLETGSQMWSVQIVKAMEWGSVTLGRDDDIILLSSRKSLTAYNPADGGVLWDTSELGFTNYGGHKYVDHAEGLILLLAKNAEKNESVSLLNAEDGSVLWTKEDVFQTKIPKNCVSNEGGLYGECSFRDVPSLYGLQDPFVDVMGNLVLFYNSDGVISLDLETGEKYFRNNIFKKAPGEAQTVSDDKYIYIQKGKKILAIQVDRGKLAWETEKQPSDPQEIIPVKGGIVVLGENFLRTFNHDGELVQDFDGYTNAQRIPSERGVELIARMERRFQFISLESVDGPAEDILSAKIHRDIDVASFETRDEVTLLTTNSELLFFDLEGELIERVPFKPAKAGKAKSSSKVSLSEILGALGGVTLSYKGVSVGYFPDSARSLAQSLWTQNQLPSYDAENFIFKKIKNKHYQMIDKDTAEVKDLYFDYGNFNIIAIGDEMFTLHERKLLRRMRVGK